MQSCYLGGGCHRRIYRYIFKRDRKRNETAEACFPAERRAYKIMPAPSDRRDGEKTGESAGNSGNKIKKDKNKEYSRRIWEGLFGKAEP